ncbi:outer membrane protein [Rhodopseudomonas parapalustris]
MRSVKMLMAAGAASLIASAAMAADMPIAPPPAYAPPPAEDFGGWYLRGDIGFSNQQVKDVRSTNPTAYSQLTSFSQQTGFDTGGTYQIGVGYQFNNWFRADITGQYRGQSSFHGTDLLTGVATYRGNSWNYNGVDDYSATKSEWLFLANAYADLGTWWCITPYVGAGVGAARVTIANFVDRSQTNLAYSPGLDTFVSGSFPGVAYAETGSKWNLAWALHTGLAYKVTPNLTVDLGYSYVNLGSGVTGNAARYDSPTAGNKFEFKDITSHDVKLGVRWNLDAGPVYPASPVLMRKG